MNGHEESHTSLTIDFHRGNFFAIIMVRYGGTHTALTIALHRGLYLAIMMTVMTDPTLPLL
jgi:hypothetical protein